MPCTACGKKLIFNKPKNKPLLFNIKNLGFIITNINNKTVVGKTTNTNKPLAYTLKF
jgi:uncharacterized protein (DUF983 family)